MLYILCILTLECFVCTFISVKTLRNATLAIFLIPGWSFKFGAARINSKSRNPRINPQSAVQGNAECSSQSDADTVGWIIINMWDGRFPPFTDTLSQLSRFDKASEERCFLFGCRLTAQRDPPLWVSRVSAPQIDLLMESPVKYVERDHWKRWG